VQHPSPCKYRTGSNIPQNINLVTGRPGSTCLFTYCCVSASISTVLCLLLTYCFLGCSFLLHASGKKISIRMHRQRPDAPGARDALDAPCQCTYCSQRETHRQCEFRHSSPRHRASGRRSPRHLLTGRSVAGHFPSRRTVRAFSFWTHGVRAFSFWMHRVRAFSFWMQSCQGIFLLDMSG